MDISYLEKIRLHELDLVVKDCPPGCNILEIGAGTGWQAKALQDMGFNVAAIDLASSCYSKLRVWPVTEYDGHSIPFDDELFDVVFSSSVLEHIPHLNDFQNEIMRVTKTGGIAIHILPSASWRFWSIISHYPMLIKLVYKIIVRRFFENTKQDERELLYNAGFQKKSSMLVKLKKAIFPGRHGELGNAFSEIYYFSRYRWIPFFHKTGWQVLAYKPNRIFYTGDMIFGSYINFTTRKLLSRVLGSSCLIYILMKN